MVSSTSGLEEDFPGSCILLVCPLVPPPPMHALQHDQGQHSNGMHVINAGLVGLSFGGGAMSDSVSMHATCLPVG